MRTVHMVLLAALLTGAGACKGTDAPTPSRQPSGPNGSGSATPGSAAADPWADQKPRPLPPPKVTDPFAHPMFWHATKDGKTTYLFGTLHGGVDAEKRIPVWVWKHFEDATTLVEEANIQDIGLQRWQIRPKGPTLREELGKEYWSKFSRMMTPVIADLLDTQSTAVAALRVAGHGGGGEMAAPMDGALLVRAQGLGKRIAFLETSAFQSDLFSSLYTVEMLRRMLDRLDDIAPLNPAFIAAYTSGDIDALDRIARAQFRIAMSDDAELERFYDKLLLARNRAWIPVLESEHAIGGAFVAVGALHFAGPKNVLELLRARGFTIERATAP